MKSLNKYDWFLISGIILWIIESGFFGWNEVAGSVAEKVFDQAAMLLIIFGAIGAFVRATRPEITMNVTGNVDLK